MRKEPLPCTCPDPNVEEFYTYDNQFSDVTYSFFCVSCRNRATSQRGFTKGNKIRAKKTARTNAVNAWNRKILKELFEET